MFPCFPFRAADLSPLQGLTRLRVLHISGAKALTLAPLARLPALEDLSMQGAPVTAEQREELRPMCEREDRVMVRFTPESTFETPPRHIYQDTDIATISHGLGATLPWKP